MTTKVLKVTAEQTKKEDVKIGIECDGFDIGEVVELLSDAIFNICGEHGVSIHDALELVFQEGLSRSPEVLTEITTELEEMLSDQKTVN